MRLNITLYVHFSKSYISRNETHTLITALEFLHNGYVVQEFIDVPSNFSAYNLLLVSLFVSSCVVLFCSCHDDVCTDSLRT